MKVAIVTDSTCDYSREYLAAHDIRMVPLSVIFGGETFLDHVEISPAEFYDKMAASSQLPSTSQPSPADFTAMYQSLADEGYEHIVSVHISGVLSGTYNSAHIAAGTSPVPVTVIDSKTTSQALGFVLDAAVAARDAGGSGSDVAMACYNAMEGIEIFFILETMDNLVRGGRAGKAAGLAASLLNIKPILTLTDGAVTPWNKAKGRKRAFQAMALHIEALAAELGPLKAALLHAVDPEAADQLKAAIVETGADVVFGDPQVIGPVLGTHVGRGAVGVAVMPRS